LSRIIRSEEAGDCQTWQLPDVRGKKGGSASPMTARQLEEVQNQARQEGFQQGLQEGREAGMKKFVEHVTYLEQLVAALSRPFEQLDEEIEQQLAQLAMIVARQLVRRELKTDPGQVVGVVREALSVLPLAARHVRLALNPEDAEMIRDALSLGHGDQTIQIIEDPVQSRGGCRVLTENSQIDATVESRLNAVIANVLGGLRSSDNPES